MLNKIPISRWSDERVIKEGQALRIAYKLKHTLRYNTNRDLTVHSESVAEHKFALFFLSEYFLPLEDPAGKLNYRVVHQIILYHDFPEIIHGDVPYVLKTAAHKEQERVDAIVVFDSLPSSIRQLARESWEMYEQRESPEALFVYALDKIEPLFELFDPVNEQTPKRLHQTYESHIEIKLAATQNYPCMHKFVEVMSEDMLRRGVFWKEKED